MDSIRVSIIQTDIVWENKQENLRLLHEKLQSLRGTTEIVVLPEMFSTGFRLHVPCGTNGVYRKNSILLRE